MKAALSIYLHQNKKTQSSAEIRPIPSQMDCHSVVINLYVESPSMVHHRHNIKNTQSSVRTESGREIGLHAHSETQGIDSYVSRSSCWIVIK